MATEVVNVPDLDLQFFGNDGKPMASGHVVFFRNGTDIPAPVFTSNGETSLGNTIELDASGFPNTQFSLKAGQLYTVKAFNSDNVLIWTRNDISGSSEGGGAGNWVPIEGTSLADPMTGPLVIKYDNKTTILDNNALQSDTAMQMSAPTVGMVASNGTATILGVPRVAINASGEDSASIYVQSDKKIEMQGTQIEIKAPNSGNEITINSKGLTEIIGGVTSVQGNNGLSLYGGGTGITINGAAKFLSTATLNNKTVNDIWTSNSTGAMTDDQLITAKAAYDMSGGGGSDWHVYKYEPRPIAPTRLSWDPAGQTNKTLCWVDFLPPGLTFSKVYLFPDAVSWGDNMKTAPDRYGWAVYRRKKIEVRSPNKGETYSKNACTGQFVNGLFEITSTPVSIPDDEYVYFIGIMVSSFYKSSYSLNINLIGTDPVDYHNWSGLGMPAGAFTNYTDIGPSIRGYATDGAMVSLPDNYVACGNYNTSPYSQRISFPWWACK